MIDGYQAALVRLAWNDAASAGVLLRLLAHGGREVRRIVAERKGLPPEVVDAILEHPDPQVQLDFAESVNADPAQRARLLLGDPSPKVWLHLAVGPLAYRSVVEPLPDWAYERLLAHPRAIVRRETVLSPGMPGHVLAALADHPEPVLRRAACRAWDLLAPAVRQVLLDDQDPLVWQAAAFHACHQDAEQTARLVAAIEGGWELGEALRSARLGRDLAQSLVNHGEHLVSLAANPSLPADLVERLATDPDPRVRLAVSARPELDEHERAAIDYTVEPEAHLGTLPWVWQARQDPDTLRRCATSAHPWLRRSAAVCPGLAPDLVDLLARDEDFAVRLLLCEFHPAPPPELLLDLYLHGSHRAVRMLITRPGFPAKGLADRFADSSDPELRSLAFRDPDMAPDVLDRLSRDPAGPGPAARHPRLPLGRLHELLADPQTVALAAGNPGIPVQDMHRLLDRAGLPA